MNESYTKFLTTNSDRTLRLYSINYDNIKNHQKSIFFSNEFLDVINRNKWMHASFFKLAPNQHLE